MSIQRFCRCHGRRLRGNTPGAMTIILDGQPFDASIVLCSIGAIDVRRALDAMSQQRSSVAEQARNIDLSASTQQLRPVPDAITEHFQAVPRERAMPSTWQPRGVPSGTPIDAQIMVPLPKTHRRGFPNWRR